MNIFQSTFAPESLVSRDRFGRPVPRQPVHSHTQANLVLTQGIPPAFRDGVHFFILSAATGSVPSLSGKAVAYRWRSLPRVCRRKASSRRGSSSNGFCLFRYRHGPISVRLSFLTPTFGTVDICDKTDSLPTRLRRRCLRGSTAPRLAGR